MRSFRETGLRPISRPNAKLRNVSKHLKNKNVTAFFTKTVSQSADRFARWTTTFFLTAFIGLTAVHGQTKIKFTKEDSLVMNRYSFLKKSKDIIAASKFIDSVELFDKTFSIRMIKYYRADCYYELKKFDEAIAICTNEISTYSDKDDLLNSFYFLKINSYREKSELTSAIYENQKLIKIFPKNVYAYHNISYLYGEVQDYKECFNALEKAFQLDSSNLGVYNNLSYYSSKAGYYDKAVRYASSGIKLAKDSSNIGSLLNNRGFGKIGLKKNESALADIEESLKYTPINPYAYYNKALAYIQLKEFDKVCSNLQKAKDQGGINLTEALLKQYCNK